MTITMKRIIQEDFISRNLDVLAAVTIFTIVFLTYSVVLFNTFGVLDDWYFLHNGITGQAGTVPLLIGAGRPINAIILNIGFAAAGSIEGLAHLRLIAIIGISFLGFFLYKFSRAQSIDFATSLLIAIGVVLLPSFHVYASWAQHFTTPFAGVLALLSAYILMPGCRIRDRSRVLAVIFSATVLVISLLIYQPLAMLFWTGVFISLVATFDFENKWNLSRLLDVFISFSIAMIVAFIVFKAGQFQYPSDSSRYGLVTDIYEKLTWFISEPLANSISLYAVPRSSTVGRLILAIFLIIFLFLGVLRGIKFAAKLALMVVFSLMLSYIPNLATAENWGSYRSIGALAASLYVSFLLIVRFLVKNIIQSYASKKYTNSVIKMSFYVIVCVFAFLSSLAQSSVSKGFVLPNVIELNNLASFLKDQNFASLPGQSILVKTSSWRDSSAAVLQYDEFGMHSSLRDHYSLIMVELVLRSIGLGSNTKVLLHSDKELPKEEIINNKTVVVDFPKLITSERFSTNYLNWKSIDLGRVYPANISDINWTAGLWTSTGSPGFYSFTYKRRYGDKNLNVGDVLFFEQSGLRTITKIDIGNDYSNILVDGGSLVSGDGFPHSVRIYK